MGMVVQIEHHEALLERYSHLIDVYLSPQSFVDRAALTEDAWAERVAAVRKEALRVLLPTKRETLVGAVKMLTDELVRMMQLKRTVLELGKVAADHFRPVGANNPLGDDAGRAKLVDLKDLSVQDLRTIQRAMELLRPQQGRNQEPPKPPPPEPIDDLLRPDAIHGAVTDPTVPRA
jgi:hypothetical protein